MEKLYREMISRDERYRGVSDESMAHLVREYALVLSQRGYTITIPVIGQYAGKDIRYVNITKEVSL